MNPTPKDNVENTFSPGGGLESGVNYFQARMISLSLGLCEAMS